MGREIVYCWKCATRLASADFDNKKAFRYQDKVSCEECVFDLVGDLPAEEQERILSGEPAPRKSATGSIKKIDGGTSRRTGAVPRATGSVPRATGSVPKATGPTKRITRSIPKVEAPPPDEEPVEGEDVPEDPAAKKKKLMILAGAGGGGLLLVVVILILALGGKKKAPVPVTPVESASTKAVPKTPDKPEPNQAAKTALIEITAFEKSNPEAVGELIKKWRELEQLAAGSDLAKDAAHSIEILLARLEKAAGAVDETLKPHLAAEEFKPLFEALAGETAKHDVPEWKAAIEKKTAQYKAIAADKWRSVKAKAEDARLNEDKAELEKLAGQVAKWGLPEYVEEFGKIASAPSTAEPVVKTPAAPAGTPAKPVKAPAAKPVFSKPLSPEMKSFLPGWQRAAGLAFNRDYDGAVSELSKAAKDVDSDEVRKAASEDGDLIRAAGEFLLGDLAKAAAGVKRLSKISVEYLHAPGTWKEISGQVSRVEGSRLEFKIQTEDPKEKKVREEIRLVEFTDLSADTLGGLLKAQKKSLDKKESLHVAVLCLLEGDLEAGRTWAAGQAVPERLLVWAGEARESAPKAGGRELEARDLFHQHELEWRKMETWGPAMEKAKTLVNEFSVTRIVRANQALLTKRMGEGKETIFLPTMLKATGDANTYQFKKDEMAWVTTKDIDDFDQCLYNYVDAEFYALPNTQYRAWIYVGGCCQPVFGALYQTTEGEISHKGKTASINPGDRVAPPIPMTSNLKKTHEDHKPKGAKEHPKTPARWAWVSLPLPKTYASPGPKTIRLLTDQAGFGVKYVVVSSTRTTLPDAAMLKELDAQAQAAIANPPAGALGPKGAPQPKDWLVIGPFEPKLAQAEEVESDIDPKKEVKGKGNVKWKPFAATVTGSNAVLDWAKSKIYAAQDNTSAYALIHVKAPDAMDAQLIMTTDDGGRAWVNGTRVHDNDRGGGFKKDEFKVRIKLEEGWNRLLFKIRNGSAGFGLQMRVVDGAGEPIGGLEWHPYGDALQP